MKADVNDRYERLKYLNSEKQAQEEKKNNYSLQISKLKELSEYHEKEIKYNEKWIGFHKRSMEKHKENNEEEKFNFHSEQINNHHNEYRKYHQLEIEFLNKEILLYTDGLNNCEQQLNFINTKIKENETEVNL